MQIPALYKKYNVDKDYTSIGLFRALRDKFDINKVFYPGSFVHITPSLIFSDVTFADSYRNTHRFFESPETGAFIQKAKDYTEPVRFGFYQQDYRKPFAELQDEFDLVISQYAGFVGQAVKRYLKKGGILVCNNSHGDATMASLDPDYTLIAVYRRESDENFHISDKNLESYLIPKSGVPPTIEQISKSMKGVAYTKSPSGYIFKKTR